MQFSTKYTSIMHSEPIIHYWMVFTSEIKTLERLITWCELFCKVLIYVHVSKQTFLSVPYLYHWHSVVYLGFYRWGAMPLCQVSRAYYNSNHCSDVRTTGKETITDFLTLAFVLGWRDGTLSNNPNISYLQFKVVNSFFHIQWLTYIPYLLFINYMYKRHQN